MLGERFRGGIRDLRQAREVKGSLMAGEGFRSSIGEFRQVVEPKRVILPCELPGQ
ncbi:MAG: hypothetical protein MK172_06115 [Verrucomicrobiales bacterium]|nr:hypothetical protein [Verrucomicrobiales bacterium]